MNTKNLLLGIFMVLVFATGFMIGRFSSVGGSYADNSSSTGTTNTAETSSGDDSTPVEASRLTEGQMKMLSAFGIDPNTVNITPEMIVCAENKLGPARIEEIKNGDTPSFTEGVSLAACYK